LLSSANNAIGVSAVGHPCHVFDSWHHRPSAVYVFFRVGIDSATVVACAVPFVTRQSLVVEVLDMSNSGYVQQTHLVCAKAWPSPLPLYFAKAVPEGATRPGLIFLEEPSGSRARLFGQARNVYCILCKQPKLCAALAPVVTTGVSSGDMYRCHGLCFIVLCHWRCGQVSCGSLHAWLWRGWV
jgi:hypothetical protein